MELAISSDNSIRWERPLADSVFSIIAQDVRRERTGIHAQINLTYRDALLAYDTFNVGRNEERQRLAKSAHALLGNGEKDAYGLDFLKHDLDLFCRLLPEKHEQGRFQLEHYDADEAVPVLTFVVTGLVIEDGGTIIFAPPGSGKSYILQLLAVCIGTGNIAFWNLQARAVLVINLERSGKSLRYRFNRIANILGIKGKNHKVEFLHARGKSFTAIAKRVAAWKTEHPDGVLAVDSISRSGLGSLNKDEVANEIIDYLNQFGTWIAIAHTPRADSDHVFGSIHFDCGEDIGVKLSCDTSQGEKGLLGLSLEVVKANDMPLGSRQYLALAFDKDGLSAIRTAKISEFPFLVEHAVETSHQKLIKYLSEVTLTTATQAAESTGIPRPTITKLFRGSDSFQQVKKVGKEVYYGLSAKETELPY